MISIIIPFYNEVGNIELLYRRLQETLNFFDEGYEVIFVDDGSKDGSFEVAKNIALSNNAIKLIQLRRNYGQTAALQAGIEKSIGEIIIPMDADLQNDPSDIQALIKKLREGFDVVSGWRKDRKDGFVRTLLSRVANCLISRISGLNLHDHGCSLKAYRRENFEGLRLYGEIHRFIPLLIYWNGASITEIIITHHGRHSGKSKYNLMRTFKVILDMITHNFLSNYYTKPNYVFGAFGFLSGFLSILTFCIVSYRVLILKSLEATPMVFLWILFSIASMLFFLMGLLAEMLTRIYFDSEERKPYRIRETVNFDQMEEKDTI